MLAGWIKFTEKLAKSESYIVDNSTWYLYLNSTRKWVFLQSERHSTMLSEIVIDGFPLLSLLTKRVLRMEHISSRFNGNLTKEWRTHLHAQISGHSVEILSAGKFMIFQQNQRNNSSNQLFSNFFSKNVGFTKFLPRDCESISEITTLHCAYMHVEKLSCSYTSYATAS